MKINNKIALGALWAVPALAQGSISIVNQGGSSVSVISSPSGGASTIAAGGGFSQGFSGSAVSLKISPESSQDGILQFEYSVSGDTLFFDLSQIDGSPFGGAWSLSGSDGCNVQQTAYQYPSDSGAQQSCPLGSSITLTLFSSGSSGSAPSSAPSSSPTTMQTVASAAATPQSTPAATPSAAASTPSAAAATPSAAASTPSASA